MEANTNQRNRVIIRYNIAGILMNLLLSAAKIIIGLLINSYAVMLDAINGFSDMATSFLSILSTMFAGKRADREHPFGYGRLEYITSMFCSAFVIFMELHADYDIIKGLFSGDKSTPKYNTAVVVLLIVSVAAKILYGLLTRREGQRINASVLVMSGTEAIGDSVVSAAILLNIAIYRITHVDLEPWLTILISLFIIKTGIEMLRDCANKLLGSKGDPELYRRVKEMIVSEEDVQNVFYLTLHNYGEELSVGSVDIEVDEGMTAAETTKLVQRIRRKLAGSSVRLASVGIYGTDIGKPENARMWDKVLEIVRCHPEFLRAYAFTFDADHKMASFLVVPDPKLRDGGNAVTLLEQDLTKAFPDVRFDIDSILDC